MTSKTNLHPIIRFFTHIVMMIKHNFVFDGGLWGDSFKGPFYFENPFDVSILSLWGPLQTV